MIQHVEHLELPAETYHLLEEIAQAQSITPSELVAEMIRRFQAMQSLSSLRHEYQRLTQKALMRTITRAEEKQMDTICVQINVLNQQTDLGYVREQRNRQADDLIAKSEQLLERVHQQNTR